MLILYHMKCSNSMEKNKLEATNLHQNDQLLLNLEFGRPNSCNRKAAPKLTCITPCVRLIATFTLISYSHRLSCLFIESNCIFDFLQNREIANFCEDILWYLCGILTSPFLYRSQRYLLIPCSIWICCTKSWWTNYQHWWHHTGNSDVIRQSWYTENSDDMHIIVVRYTWHARQSRYVGAPWCIKSSGD